MIFATLYIDRIRQISLKYTGATFYDYRIDRIFFCVKNQYITEDGVQIPFDMRIKSFERLYL